MTIRVLEKTVLKLPPRSHMQFAEKILPKVEDFTAANEKAWEKEIGRRVSDIQAGNAKGVLASVAMANARRALTEIRSE